MPQGSDTFLTQGSWVSVVTFAWPICFLVLAILPQPTFFFFLFYLIAFHILFKVTLTLYGARLNICIHTYVLGWPRSQYGFFHKIDTFFVFTNNFIDIDISSMSAISQVVEHWFFSINVSIWSLPTSTALRDCGTSSSQKSSAQNFTNHFWHIRSVTAPSLYTAQIFFLRLCCVFTFLEIIKHNTLKMFIFFHLQY